VSKEQKNRTKKVLEKFFSKEDCVLCNFFKTSKDLVDYQHKIVFKTRKKIKTHQIKEAQKNLSIEFGDKVYEIPFFDSIDVKS